VFKERPVQQDLKVQQVPKAKREIKAMTER
jgi:hypothetical protein